MWIRITLAILALAVLDVLSQDNPQKVTRNQKKRAEMVKKLRSLLSEQDYDDFFELLGEDRVSDYLEMLIGYREFARTVVHDALRLYNEDTRPQSERRACRWQVHLQTVKAKWYSVYRHYTLTEPIDSNISRDLAMIYGACCWLD